MYPWNKARWKLKTVQKADTGSAVVASACLFGGGYLSTDGANNPTITLHNNASAASGDMALPTATYDASQLGLNGGLIGWPGAECDGLYLTFTCAGTAYLTIFYKLLTEL